MVTGTKPGRIQASKFAGKLAFAEGFAEPLQRRAWNVSKFTTSFPSIDFRDDIVGTIEEHETSVMGTSAGPIRRQPFLRP